MDWTALVGTRVVVRYRLPDGRATDAVGVLREADAAMVVLDARTGPVRIAVAAVVASRAVPPRPVRRGPAHLAQDVAGLEAVMARHWLPADHARLGEWLLRAAEGFTGRGNSVLAAGDPGLPLAGPGGALAAVRAWYTQRSLPPMAAVPEGTAADPVPAHTREAFLADGWRVRERAGALVLTAATAGLRAQPRLPAGLRLDLAAEPDQAWLGTYHYRGQAVPPIGRALLLSAPEQAFASVRAGGRTVAVARGSLASGWAGLTAVDVDAGYRRQGLAGAMLAAIATWAWRRRAPAIYLQVADENAAAIAMYADAGFTVHHRYDYWVAGSGPQTTRSSAM